MLELANNHDSLQILHFQKVKTPTYNYEIELKCQIWDLKNEFVFHGESIYNSGIMVQ